MEAIFDSLGKTIYSINGHKGYMIQWKLIAPFCKKWSRNRDPDMERVLEMVEHHNKGGYIPRMIHLAVITDEGVVCYDGNHRKEVFNTCNDEAVMCVVDIMFDASQNSVYKAFNNINKSVQLPAIYIEESNDENDVKAQIVKLVREYETKYKPFLSTSARCHAPHFNRDMLTDNIYSIYKSFCNAVSIEQIGKLLIRLNVEYAHGRMCRPHSLYKQSLLDKCKKHNIWLFIEKTIPFEHVERLLNSR
jgi:hypothetical protein